MRGFASLRCYFSFNPRGYASIHRLARIANRRIVRKQAGSNPALKLNERIVAVLSCIHTPTVSDAIQLAEELRVEDAFVSAFGRLNLKLRFFMKEARLIPRILIAQQAFFAHLSSSLRTLNCASVPIPSFDLAPHCFPSPSFHKPRS